MVLKHAIISNRPAIVKALAKKILPGNDIIALAIEESGKESLEVLTGRSSLIYSDQDIRLSIRRALEKERIEEVKTVVSNQGLVFTWKDIYHLALNASLKAVSYVVSESSDVEYTLLMMIERGEHRGLMIMLEALFLSGASIGSIIRMIDRQNLHPIIVKYFSLSSIGIIARMA